jgi:hypothetical protein
MPHVPLPLLFHPDESLNLTNAINDQITPSQESNSLHFRSKDSLYCSRGISVSP